LLATAAAESSAVWRIYAQFAAPKMTTAHILSNVTLSSSASIQGWANSHDTWKPFASLSIMQQIATIKDQASG